MQGRVTEQVTGEAWISAGAGSRPWDPCSFSSTVTALTDATVTICFITQ